MERLIKQYSGQGQLILNNNETVPVSYRIDEFQCYVSDGMGGEVPTLRDTRGQVAQLKGRRDWHPIVSIQSEPFTLVMSDGRKLKVLLINSDGDVQGTGGFF
jgi:hypothetical protein